MTDNRIIMYYYHDSCLDYYAYCNCTFLQVYLKNYLTIFNKSYINRFFNARWVFVTYFFNYLLLIYTLGSYRAHNKRMFFCLYQWLPLVTDYITIKIINTKIWHIIVFTLKRKKN